MSSQAPTPHPSDARPVRRAETETTNRRTSRRSFIAGAGAGTLGLALLGEVPAAAAAGQRLTSGDEAILRFLAAA